MQLSDLSIVVPVYQDEGPLNRLLGELSEWPVEWIIAYSGVRPELTRVPQRLKLVACAKPGRGQQLAQGVAAAGGQWLWLLHADSRVGSSVKAQLRAINSPCWGRFDIRLDSQRPVLKLVATMMNWRSGITGICTGDQGIFSHRTLLEASGGVPLQPLMEDIELSRRLKHRGRPVRLTGPLISSARRWERNGVWNTIAQMWCYRIRYFFGASPVLLAADYYDSNERGS